jgi:hypothetical protein
MLSLSLILIVIGLLFYTGFGLTLWLTQASDDKFWVWTRLPFWGFGFSAIFLLYLSQVGIPTRVGIWIVLGCATVINGLALRYRWSRSREFFGSSYALLLIPSIILLILVAWPAIWMGLEYMSHFNEDMWRYSIVADWFSQHGYFDPPGARDLATNFVHADAVAEYFGAHYRVLVEEFLSGVVSLLGGYWQARQMFTPVIASFAFIAPLGIFAFARDVLQLSIRRAWGVAFLFALLSTYQWGVYQQLLAQTIGIPLMFLAVAEYAVYKSSRSWVSVGRLAGMILMLVLGYPEILLFAIIPVGADLIYSLLKRTLPLGWTIKQMAAISIGVLVAGHINTWYFFSFLGRQLFESVSKAGSFAFPYFFRASALPALYGLISITSNLDRSSYWNWIGYGCTMLTGVALVVVTLYGGWQLLRQRNILAISLLGVFVSSWLFFYWRRTDFALFKASLFISLVLLIVAVYGVFTARTHSNLKPKTWLGVLVASLVLIWVGLNLGVSAQTSIGSLAGGEFAGAGIDVPRGLSEINAVAQYVPAGGRVALATRLYSPLEWMSTLLPKTGQTLVVPPPWRFGSGVFDSPSDADWDQAPVGADAILTVDGKAEDLFEPFAPQGLLWSGELFSLYSAEKFYPWVLPFSTPEGKLVAPKNVYGNSYPTALFALEHLGSHPVSWMGSNLALRILASQPESVRLVVSQSNAILGKPLPDAEIYVNRHLLRTVATGGSGERRNISPPFQVQPDGRDAITAGNIDLVMRAAPTLIPSATEPLLLGGEIPQDLRLATTLLTDLFLVRESDFENRRVPRVFTAQEGIQNRLLDCGGFYADEWVSPIFWTELNRRESDTDLVIRGQVPGNVGVKFPMVVTAVVDGSPIGQQAISRAGDFGLAFKLAPSAGNSVVNVRFEFSHGFILPNNDGRLASAQLYQVGFESGK